MQAVEKKDRFLERRDRIIARFSGRRPRGLPAAAARGGVRDPRARRRPRHPRARGALPRRPRQRRARLLPGRDLLLRRRARAGRRRTSRRSSPSSRTTSSRSSTAGIAASESGDTVAAEAALQPRDRAQARRVPAALRARARSTRTCRAGRRPRRRSSRALDCAPVPSAHILLGNVLREKGELSRAIHEFEEAHAARARVRGGGLPARPLLPREELAQARARVLPAGAREEPAAPRVPGGRAPARAPAAATSCRAWTARARRRSATPRRAPRAGRCRAPRSSTARPCAPSRAIRRSASPSRCSPRPWAAGRRRSPPAARSSRRTRRTSSRRRPARRWPRRCGPRAARARPREFLREFLEKHPSKTAQAVGYYELATSLAESGEDLDLALDYAGRALAAAPEELKPYPLAALGWVHYKRQEYDRAIECLRRSSERAAAPTTLHHLGMAYLAAGRAEEAKAAFAKAKTAARGAGIEDRMMQQLRSNLRLVEKVGPRKRRSRRPEPAAVSRAEVRPRPGSRLTIPALVSSRPHALVPILPADRPRGPRRRRGGLARPPDPRRDDPPGGRRHLLAHAARAALAPQDRADRPRGDRPGGRPRGRAADPPAARALGGERAAGRATPRRRSSSTSRTARKASTASRRRPRRPSRRWCARA